MFQLECANPTGLRSRRLSDHTAQFRRKKSSPAASSDRSRRIPEELELQNSYRRFQRQKNGRELDCVQENRAQHKNVATTGCPKRARLRMPDGTPLASRQVSRPERDKVAAWAGPTALTNSAEFLRG